MFLFFLVLSAIELSPEAVIQRVKTENIDAKRLKTQVDQARVILARANALFDWNIAGEIGFEQNKNETISGQSNFEDKTTLGKVQISKKLISGTQVRAEVSRIFQDSRLNPNFVGMRPEEVYQDTFGVELQQELLKNSLGISDRLFSKAQELRERKSYLEYKESLESVILSVLKLYFEAYVAKQTLLASEASAKKYRVLEESLRNKYRRGLSDKADFLKVSASLDSEERRTLSYRLLYQNILSQLLAFLKMEQTDDIDFVEVEKVGAIESAETENIRRSLQIAQLELEAAEYQKRSAWWNAVPSLNVFASMAMNGVDAKGGEAFSQMSDFDYPRYQVGLRFSVFPWSNINKAIKIENEAAWYEAGLQLEKTRDFDQVRLNTATREYQTKKDLAERSKREERRWSEVVQEQERRFNKGVVSLNELILDFASLFRASASLSSAVSDYYLSYIEWKSAHDSLVD